MNKKMYCQICESDNEFIKVVTIKNQRPQDFSANEFTYYRCSVCTYYLLDPKVSPEEINKIYEKEEYYEELASKPKNKFLTALFQFKLFSSYQDFTKENIKLVSKVLDIGCGNGEFLESLQKDGYTVYGLDPYPVAVQNTKKKIGDNKVFSGYISELKNINESFDAITMWHVLEHVQHPLQDLKKINEKLNAEGKIIIEVPNADSLAFRIFGQDYNYNMIPEHIQYYNPKSITKLCNKAGFKIIKCYTPPRALLNFALSLKNKWNDQITSTPLKVVFFLLATPVSVLFISISSIMDQGEVLRVVAQKE
ncbi:MAG: class I SAM-dependent methyltransferase [bacterium]|nr:class I SAM-dependent methyltransferase [bacterium]